MGKGIVDRLKGEFAIEETWVSYELHPETPPEGVLLAERFRGRDLSGFYESLRERGKEFGLVFGDRKLLSNSRLSLEASEYARDRDRYAAFHEDVFRTYFTDGLDIGDPRVILSIAKRCGLDGEDMAGVLNEGRYASRLDEARKEGAQMGLTGVPTFIVNEKYKIVGAQPVEVFSDFFRKMASGR